MKKKLLLLFLIFLVISFISNFYIEQKLYETFSKIKREDIMCLEHHSNKNFYQYGIENIGENLQQELLEMKIDQCRLNVRKDLFYIFRIKLFILEMVKKA